MTKSIKYTLAAALCVAFVMEAASSYTGIRVLGIVAPAEAKVGRPLTPVSVAGVGRRTARRCANGTYDC